MGEKWTSKKKKVQIFHTKRCTVSEWTHQVLPRLFPPQTAGQAAFRICRNTTITMYSSRSRSRFSFALAVKSYCAYRGWGMGGLDEARGWGLKSVKQVIYPRLSPSATLQFSFDAGLELLQYVLSHVELVDFVGTQGSLCGEANNVVITHCIFTLHVEFIKSCT